MVNDVIVSLSSFPAHRLSVTTGEAAIFKVFPDATSARSTRVTLSFDDDPCDDEFD